MMKIARTLFLIFFRPARALIDDDDKKEGVDKWKSRSFLSIR